MTRSLVTDQDLASLSLMAHVSSGAGLPAGCFARELEARGRARATVTRQPCTIAGFYTYAVEEELLKHSPAAHVRRPRLDYESHAVGLDRNELGALLFAAGLGWSAEYALSRCSR